MKQFRFPHQTLPEATRTEAVIISEDPSEWEFRLSVLVNPTRTCMKR